MLYRMIFGRRPRRTLVRALLWAVLTVVAFKFFFVPVRAWGISMEPTWESGGLHLANMQAYRWRNPERGDIVTIRLAGGVLVKRIIGLPGERLSIVAGVVQIDSRPLDEPYVKQRASWNLPERRLGTREYFVIGDNRSMLITDHDLRTVSRDVITGRFIF
jgi:signal peptidase I